MVPHYLKNLSLCSSCFPRADRGACRSLTVELICLLFAAWKAPAWVKEIGLLALVSGIVWELFGLYGVFGALRQMPDISNGVLAGGFRVALIPLLYGLLIYAVSLVIRMLQKPRI